jgi:hypothetical protein
MLVDVGPQENMEEAREAGKTWNEVRSLVTNRTRWRSFTDTLFSRRSYRN